jgi:hypothetical protein
MRRFRRLPSPALVISAIALVLAVGGGTFAIAALSHHDKKVVTKIANKQINKKAPTLSVKHAQSADTAANATKLGGVAASGYQASCKPGAIKASLVENNFGFNSATFQNVPGFNCFQPGNTTTSVQLKRTGTGTYVVRFVGNMGADNSGSAVCSPIPPGFEVSCFSGTDPEAPGEVVFTVHVANSAGSLTDDAQFTLLAF